RVRFRPAGAATCQPRATPWEPRNPRSTMPCKGATRNRSRPQALAPNPRKVLRGGNVLWGPFRAGVILISGSQGVALGWPVAAPSGRRTKAPLQNGRVGLVCSSMRNFLAGVIVESGLLPGGLLSLV